MQNGKESRRSRAVANRTAVDARMGDMRPASDSVWQS